MIAIAAALVVSLAGGCATHLAPLGPYEYFGSPSGDDAWSQKIRAWQQRELSGVLAPPTQTSGPETAAGVEDAGLEHAGVEHAGLEHPGLERARVGDLRTKYDTFRNERRRSLARDIAGWIQTEARSHYVPDGPIDHWATFQETFQTNGDDCDGLELLVFHFLRDLGFPEDQVFRAIVVRRTDGQHHMVTLWFEDPQDPWVIDPTGAMTSGMPRLSEVPEWVPLKIFSDRRDFTVRDRLMLTATTTR